VHRLTKEERAVKVKLYLEKKSRRKWDAIKYIQYISIYFIDTKPEERSPQRGIVKVVVS
jgi:hypothetical protein